MITPAPQEAALSGKRRVQVFVLAAIALFVGAGVVANRYVTAGHRTPRPATPSYAGDVAVAPSPEASASRPPAPSAPPPRASRRDRPAHKALRAKKKRSAAPSSASPSSTSGGLPAENEAVRLTNVQRAQHGCGPLRIDSRLRAAARLHSEDMRLRHYFSHDSLAGKSPWDRIRAAGYAYPGAENIAKGYATAQAVVTGWMNSPGHRENILNCRLKAVGIGVERGAGGPWWTQDFGLR